MYFIIITCLYPLENTPPKASLSIEQFQDNILRAKDLQTNGKYTKAINILELFQNNIKNNIRQVELQKQMCEIYSLLGTLYWNIGDLNRSSQYYNKAIRIAKEHYLETMLNYNQKAVSIIEYYTEGKKYRSSGNHKKSIDNFNSAIEIAKKIKSEEHEVKCLRVMSTVYLNLGNLEDFFSLNKKALDIARRLQHKKEEGRCLNNIGIYYKNINNFSGALKYFENALKIANSLKNKWDESDILNNIGNIYKKIGNYDKSLSYIKRALELDNELRNNINIAIDLINIGDIYRSKGALSKNKKDLDKALFYFDECLKIIRELKKNQNKLGIINIIEERVLNNLGKQSWDCPLGSGKLPKSPGIFQSGLPDGRRNKRSRSQRHDSE